jgi:type I restriction enzyme, S subunit
LLSEGFISVVDSSTYGAKMPRASWDFIGACAVPCPGVDEQRAIANFLDRETAKLDTLVEKKRALIEKLKEKRAALISRTVTRGLPPDAARAAGLNPHPKLKPSGIEWLGDVPEHWNTPPLYMRYSIELGKMLDESRITGKHLIPYLRNIDVQWDRINIDDLPEMDIHVREYERYILKQGDLLVCEGGEVGRAAIVKNDGDVIGFQKALHRLRPTSENENSRFMFYTLYWASIIGVFLAEGNPNTIPHLTGEKLRRYRFPCPPVDEQRAIADYLDRETAKIDRMVEKVEAAIERLREYRTALITASVTGKIDVRGAGAPALTPGPSPADAGEGNRMNIPNTI